MKLSEDDAKMLLDELAALDVPVRQPGDIDRWQYAERMGVNAQTAERRLTSFVAQGILVKIPMVYDPDKGKRLNVWRKVPLR